MKRPAADVVPFALAAGNEDANACNSSPPRVSHSNVHVVSAIDDQDRLASFSNWGPCVTVAAPGVDVLSLRAGGGTIKFNGTSMAAPHVAGLLLGGATLGQSGTALGDPDGSPDPIAHR